MLLRTVQVSSGILKSQRSRAGTIAGNCFQWWEMNCGWLIQFMP